MSTLCYLQRDGKYLMLHRTVKERDVNKDKWIGVGGHFKLGESPEECVCREVREETGYILHNWRYRGLVTFDSGSGDYEYMSLFTSDNFSGQPIPCDEGVLEWVDRDAVWKLNIWAGDKIFFRLLDEEVPFFSLKLVYNGHDKLVSAVLNGQPMELFDVLHEDGTRSGVVQERNVVHREGDPHGTVHIWIVRPSAHCPSGYEVLLQKRSANKDSNPGCLDISAAGHIDAGDEPMESALRELGEELGIHARPEDLKYLGVHRGYYEKIFHGRMFRDFEFAHLFLYTGEFDEDSLVLQESEVESVRWMDLEACRRLVEGNREATCIYPDEFRTIREALHRL
ncbi:MAG: NUDIX domain-containing protein [Bilifractor sp.]